MPIKYPFIYIAALMRTGSTLLSESLTGLPYAFIFREPHIGKNIFRAKPADIALFRENGFDLAGFLRNRNRFAFLLRRFRSVGFPQDYMVRVLKQRMIPELEGIALQVGVKEIDNRGWQNYQRHFPEMRVILTGRDPRDIYISAYRRWESGIRGRRKSITPQTIAAELNQQFQLQKEIAQATDHIKVSYEQLCLDPAVLAEILAFAGSPLSASGKIGQFNASHPPRQNEYELHGNQITDQRVGRWRRETDQKLRADAQEVFDLMADYALFWDYPAT